MSVSAALLRLLLSLVLILNGIGTVAASARMAGTMDGTAGAHHAALSKPVAAKHCAQDAAAGAMDHHAGHGDTSTPPCGDHMTPDCCDSSACGCACAQSGCSALFAVTQLPLVFVHGDLVPLPFTGHAAPALAFPIRPPIV